MSELKNQLPDEELMTLYQSGDSAAFEALYQRHSGRVLAYLQRRTDSQAAIDLLQEIFLKLHKVRHQYLPQYPFLPWLFAITRNALVDSFRLKESRIQEEKRESFDFAAPVNRSAWAENLVEALQSLPARERRAIELRYQSDWTFEQIASEMKTSPVNVRQIISRGIRKLRSRGGIPNE
jgi:RNA polymerase sigma-70 factor (ECF subfamily)